MVKSSVQALVYIDAIQPNGKREATLHCAHNRNTFRSFNQTRL